MPKNEDGETGCAFFAPKLHKECSFKFSSSISIFSAEAVAIWKALEYVFMEDLNNIIIFSDSLSLLKSMLQTWSKVKYFDPHILRMRVLLEKMDDKNILIVWVKGHCGIINNEYVDKLAKHSVIDASCTLIINPTFKETLRTITKTVLKQWTKWYEDMKKTKPTNFTSVVTQLPFKMTRQHTSRFYFVILNRLKSTHCLTKTHLKKINILDSDLCDFCQQREDIDHIFLECRKYELVRTTFLTNLRNLKVECPFNINNLLSLNNSSIFDEIIKFVKNSGINL